MEQISLFNFSKEKTAKTDKGKEITLDNLNWLSEEYNVLNDEDDKLEKVKTRIKITRKPHITKTIRKNKFVIERTDYYKNYIPVDTVNSFDKIESAIIQFYDTKDFINFLIKENAFFDNRRYFFKIKENGEFKRM